MSDQILNDKPKSSILVGDGGRKSWRRFWRSGGVLKKTLIIAGLVTIVAAGITAVLLMAGAHHDKPVVTHAGNIYDKDYSQAVSGLQSAGDRKAKAEAYIKLAQAEFNLGKYQPAIKDYNNALATNEPSVEKAALSGLAYSYVMTNQRTKAIQMFTRLIALMKKEEPNNTMAIEDYQAELARVKEGKSL